MKDFGITDLLSRTSLYIALAAAWIAMTGSLYFSEVLHYVPCTLCWYQRIAMYPLTLIIAVGLLRRDDNLPYYVLPLSLLGQSISTYHYLVQKTHIFGVPTACQAGVPCTSIWINWFGFITIPFLAMMAFFVITIMVLLAITAGEPMFERRGRSPWVEVGLTVGVILLAFFLLYQLRGPRTQTMSLTEVALAPELVPNSSATTGTPAPSVAVADTQGAKLYAEVCAVCHGPGATGMPNLGPSLVDSDIIHGDPASALAAIRAGFDLNDPTNQTGLVMPPSGGRPDLSDDQLMAIIDYLRSK